MLKNLQKGSFFLLVLLVSIPGCGGGKKKKVESVKVKNSEIATQVNIPVAGEQVSFFDEDVEAFTLVENDAQASQGKITAKVDLPLDDFSWVEEAANDSFKAIYFGFDNPRIAKEQHDAVQKDIELAKKMIAEGENPTIVIEGHACHAAGSRTYNMAISEERAKQIADRFVAAGIARENIKIVARGSEIPARDAQGKVITGNRDEQWPNRRGEVRVICS